ncbi:MAG: cell division protein FtsA [Bacteroidales bacterium]|nr:cell division protein FtsA [Bacteroidales bacterium]
MNTDSTYVVVLDVGSSRLLGCLACRQEDKWRILASERREIDTEIRRGVIQKIAEVGGLIREVVDALAVNEVCPCRIDEVYVGLNAYTMQSLFTQSQLELDAEQVVDDKTLEQLWAEALGAALRDDKDNIAHFVQNYVVDGFNTNNPIGERPRKLAGQYKMVVCRSQITRNLEDAFTIAGVNYRQKLGILASAEAVLTPEDKDKGVVALDFGAETIGICIWQGSVVRHLSVLPFGGSNITRDLTQLGMSMAEAETLKCKDGTALHYTELMLRANKNNGKRLDFEPGEKQINEIIVARIEEMVENIWAQIRYSVGTPSLLSSGIVITGGASRLNDLEVLLQHKTGLPVRKGRLESNLVDTDVNYISEEYAQCVGLLLLSDGPSAYPLPKAEPEEKVQTDLFGEKVEEEGRGWGRRKSREEKPKKQREEKPREPKPEKPSEPSEEGKTKSKRFGGFGDLFGKITDVMDDSM